MIGKNLDSQSSLWDKRINFANEIRRAQRNSIIGEKRKILYKQHLEQLAIQKGSQIENVPYFQLIKGLQQGQAQQKILYQLSLRLQSPNQNPRMIINQIFNSGKYCYLLQNLNQSRYIKQTLSIFSIILARPDIEKTRFLINKGFMENLMELFPKNIQLAGMIANIIGNICIDSDDYCDWLLENYQQAIFFDIFMKLYDMFNENHSTQSPEKDLQTMLWMLSIIVGTKDSVLDFTTQYDEILTFCRDLLEKRILLKDVIQVIYELAQKNPQRVQQIIHPILNELLEDQTGQSSHLQNLLYLIYKLTPGNFNYNLVVKVTLVAEYSITRVVLLIIQKLEDSTALGLIVNDEAWWEKMLIKLESKSQQHKFALSIIRKLNIDFPCVWRFVSEYLESTSQKDTVIEIMIFLRNSLLAASQSYERGIQLLQNLKRVNIQKSLNKILFKEKYFLAERVEELLFLIHHVTRQLKEKFEVQIEV